MSDLNQNKKGASVTTNKDAGAGNPTDVTASSIAQDAFRPGKSRIQQMSDGSILMQSVAEIAFERVCRVQIPYRLQQDKLR